MSQASLPLTAYQNVRTFGSFLQSLVLLLMRVAWGVEAAQSGWAHLHDIQQTADYFRELHIPMPVANVYISGSVELVGGALLILGLGSRLVSLPFLFNFLIAIVTAGGPKIAGKLKSGLLDGWTQTVDDTAFPFFILGLVILAFGPGKFSIDYILQRAVFHEKNAPEGF